MSRHDSSFLNLIEKLDSWYEGLPGNLQLTPLQLYVHKDTNTLGALFFLHMGYHGAMTDLTRVSLPGFEFPLAESFKSVTPQFRKECQRRCRYHSDEVSRVIALGLQHGTQPFDDPFCHVVAFETTKVQVVHSATATDVSSNRQATADNIRTNMKLMKLKEALPDGIIVSHSNNPCSHRTHLTRIPESRPVPYSLALWL